MDPTGNSYMEGYYSDYDAEGESGDDDAEEEDDENAEEGEEEEPDPFEHWDNLYDTRRMSTEDMEAPGPGGRWSKFYTTYGGGPEGGLAYLYEHDDETVPLGLYEWSRTWFSLIRLRHRALWRAVYAAPEPGVEKVRLVQLIEPFYELREEWEEQWFDEVVANLENEEQEQEQEQQEQEQEQVQEQEQEEDAPSEQSDFDFGFTMSKEAMEDALDTLLEERGAPHLTPQAWDEIKHTMRNWIDNTLDDGLVEAVRDLLQERWTELMNPLILQTVAVELVGDGETRPTRTFTIKTPYLPLPTFRLRCLLDATVVEVKVGLANYIMEHLHPERPIDGDMMLFRQPRVDNRGADGEMSTMRAFGERDTFTLEVDYPEFPSFVQVEQGRVAGDLQLNFVPNETTTEDPPTTVATAGTPPAESEDDSADSADYTEFLEIFRV